MIANYIIWKMQPALDPNIWQHLPPDILGRIVSIVIPVKILAFENRFQNEEIFNDRCFGQFFLKYSANYLSHYTLTKILDYLSKQQPSLIQIVWKLMLHKFSQIRIQKMARGFVKNIVSTSYDVSKFLVCLKLLHYDQFENWFTDVAPWISRTDNPDLLARVINKSLDYQEDITAIIKASISTSIKHDNINNLKFLEDKIDQPISLYLDLSIDNDSIYCFRFLISRINQQNYFDKNIVIKSIKKNSKNIFDHLSKKIHSSDAIEVWKTAISENKIYYSDILLDNYGDSIVNHEGFRMVNKHFGKVSLEYLLNKFASHHRIGNQLDDERKKKILALNKKGKTVLVFEREGKLICQVEDIKFQYA